VKRTSIYHPLVAEVIKHLRGWTDYRKTEKTDVPIIIIMALVGVDSTNTRRNCRPCFLT